MTQPPASQQPTTSDGLLVTIEGIDGSGKSTVVDSLEHSDFTDLVPDVTFTREPTSSDAGQLLRDILKNDNSHEITEFFLFMADHCTHLQETVLPALEAGELVVCDRYIDSRCAYQGHTLDGYFEDAISFIYESHQPWSRMPDCTILLDLDPETSVERTSSGEKYETKERLTSIRENYETVQAADADRFVTVDATQSPEKVRSDVRSVIREQIALQTA